MRTYFMSAFWLFITLACFAQKPRIDSNAIKIWTSIEFPQISNDGVYASYLIENKPLGGSSLVVLDTKNIWKLEFPGSKRGSFTSDSKHFIFIKGKDSLGIVEMGDTVVQYINNVESYSVPGTKNPEWLIYQFKNTQKSLILKNLISEKVYLIGNVQQYLLSRDGSTLLYLVKEKDDSMNIKLNLLNLSSGETKNIWKGFKAGNFIFDKNAEQLAFTVESYSGEKTFWYYNDLKSERATELASNQSIKNDKDMRLESIINFSVDGTKLFVRLKRTDIRTSLPALVDVWSYSDSKLQSAQLNEEVANVYKAVINIQSAQMIRLERDNERLFLSFFQDSGADDWGLIVKRSGIITEQNWNRTCAITTYLVSTNTGIRTKISQSKNVNYNISPHGKYLIYYNPEKKSFYSYEIQSGIMRDVTKNLKIGRIGYLKDHPESEKNLRGIAAWIKNDAGLLIYDESDIWQIDMSGRESPINLTNGYGKKHNIVFSLGLRDYDSRMLLDDERVVINAFNVETKRNGFYSMTLSQVGDPDSLTMGSYLYCIPDNPYIPANVSVYPEKAKRVEKYLVRRMRGDDSPNLFSTSDFKTFIKLSDVHPEKQYNWLTSELVNWKGLDGRLLQGVLYKPENFDARKTYPVIIQYYEKRSDGVNAFLEPDILTGDMNINIPYYVSNGYLVFQPDISYSIGEPGASAFNSVVSAAKYLSKLPCVDGKKIGIQGGSFGGYETNYLVTHTDIFAAACSSAGLSDIISNYGGLFNDGGSKQGFTEYGQLRVGASLWEKPEIYVKNSPIFSAARVVTPVLMMQATLDDACTLINNLELYTALRRLGKRSWMLQYADGNHGVWGKSAIDFSIRMKQFFDHYLKDSAAPRWMMYGIPASQKGIDDGLDLVREKDPKTGKWVTPKEGTLLTDEERKKVQTLRKRKPITLTLE